MSPEQYERMERLFEQASALPEAERGTFLAERCGDDAEVRDKVLKMLARDDDTATGLDRPAMGESVPDIFNRPADTRGEKPGDTVGRYTLREVLGEGGFGVVWLADQRKPVRRRVALKVIKPGMDSRQVIARFRAEEQALALMNHPGVARVLDAGTTDDGRPYFAMEHVPGVPITEHCDRGKLSIAERLDLFCKTCEAVQHAHQKGVIHRDIKPSNILVAVTDSGPTPKVIDFGIAKALSQELTEETIFTQQGQVIGTPAYMSPEQAQPSAQDIDTRSDVYSLGVLLYELLTGGRPFELTQAGLMEIQRQIVEADPPKPSTSLSEGTEARRHEGTKWAEQRGTDPHTLTKLLRGDLDWIVMKCLEKDRLRRYGTASALAEDVQRHLDDEPVQAGPPSATYRVGKFVRRNRLGVTAAALIVVVLLGGVAGTTWGLLTAVAARNAESVAKAEAEQRALELEQVADFQAEQLGSIDVAQMGVRLRRNLLEQARVAMGRSGVESHVIDERLSSLEDGLAGTNFTDLALKTLDEDIFSTSLVAIDEQFVDQPLVQAQLLQSVARTMRSIGLLAAATDPQERAMAIRRRTLGDDHPVTLNSIGNMGGLLRSQGKLSEAQSYYREAIDGRRRVLGDEHPVTLAAIFSMGSLQRQAGKHVEAEATLREALEAQRRVMGDDHPDTIATIEALAIAMASEGKLAEAEPLFLEALDLKRRVHGDDHRSTLVALNNLGVFTNSLGRPAEAERFHREGLEKQRRVLGDTHPSTLQSINNLAVVLRAQGKYDEAEPLQREALEVRRRTLGDMHPGTLESIQGMGAMMRRRGDLDQAKRFYREAMAGYRRLFGEDHKRTLQATWNLGRALQQQRQFAEADQLFQDVLDRRRRTLGDTHERTLGAIHWIGVSLKDRGKLAEAEAHLREALDGRRTTLGPDHGDTLTTNWNLASVLKRQGQLAEAETQWLETLEGRRRVLGDDHPLTVGTASDLGVLLAELGRFADAEPYFQEVLDGRRRTLGDVNELTLLAVHRMGVLLRDQEKLPEAEAYFREALAGRRSTLGPDHTSTCVTAWDLGNVLRMQGQFAEAETHWLEALEGRRRVLGVDHPLTLGTASDLGLLLARQGRFAEAEPYYAEAIEISRRLHGDSHPDTLNRINDLAELLSAMERYAESEAVLRENLARIEGSDAIEPSLTAETRGLLGALLTSLARFEEAEAMLVAGHAELVAVTPDDHARGLAEATRRFIELYSAWEKPERVAEWQAKLEALEALEAEPQDR